MFRKNKNLFYYASLSLLLAAFFIYQTITFEKSFPTYDELLFSEGELSGKATANKYNTQFSLSNMDGKFVFHSTSGKLITVRNMVNSSTVLRVGYTQDKRDMKSIYELAIDGKMVRSYEEITAAQRSDQKWAFLLILIFILNAIFLFRMARKQ